MGSSNNKNPIAPGTAPSGQEEKRPFNFDLFWPFVCLLLVEIIAFGINAGRVGIYQDEWITFGKLHFAPHSLPQLIAASLSDGRRIVRPLECLNIPVLYYLVWEKPLWYHIASYSTEFFSGWFLFLALAKLTKDKAAALAAAVLFLVYPTHDCSHYSIIVWDLTVAASFFTMSLWLLLKGLEEKHLYLILLSALAYIFSIYNYEAFLPMVFLYCPLIIWRSKERNTARYLAYLTPFMLSAASLLLYRCWLLPRMNLGWHYTSSLDLPHFFSVIGTGIRVSIFPEMWLFCWSMACSAIQSGLPAFGWAGLALTMCSVFLCLSRQSASCRTTNYVYVLMGAVVLILSYTIYGLSTEHMPTIDTGLNRVNLGGSLGACLVLVGVFGMLRASSTKVDACSSENTISRLLKPSMFAIVVAALTGFFILVDWQLAKPWIVSWKAQAELISMIKRHADDIRPGDSIIIGGITRYVSRSTPVVDGVLDFQNMVRTTLNDQSINGTVVTERLSMDNDKLTDQLSTLILSTFPFKQMILYAPDKSAWVRISTRQEFLQQAQRLGWHIRDSGQATQSPSRPPLSHPNKTEEIF